MLIWIYVSSKVEKKWEIIWKTHNADLGEKYTMHSEKKFGVPEKILKMFGLILYFIQPICWLAL